MLVFHSVSPMNWAWDVDATNPDIVHLSIPENNDKIIISLSRKNGEYITAIETKDGVEARQLADQGLIVLNTQVTPELEREGLARDLVRLIQTTRKDAGLDVSDRIDLRLALPDDMRTAAQEYEAFIKAETLALSLSYDEKSSDDGAVRYRGTHDLDKGQALITIL